MNDAIENRIAGSGNWDELRISNDFLFGGVISTYRDLGLSDDAILKKLQKKYHLSEEEIME